MARYTDKVTGEEARKKAHPRLAKLINGTAPGAPEVKVTSLVVRKRTLAINVRPNPDVWPKRLAKPDPRHMDTRRPRFPSELSVDGRVLSSLTGCVLRWLVKNPGATIADIARESGMPAQEVRNAVQRLKKYGIVGQVKRWVVNPTLVGSGRPFLEE